MIAGGVYKGTTWPRSVRPSSRTMSGPCPDRRSAPEIEQAAQTAGYDRRSPGRDADRGRAQAKAMAQPGDTVLLAPAWRRSICSGTSRTGATSSRRRCEG